MTWTITGIKYRSDDDEREVIFEAENFKTLLRLCFGDYYFSEDYALSSMRFEKEDESLTLEELEELVESSVDVTNKES